MDRRIFTRYEAMPSILCGTPLHFYLETHRGWDSFEINGNSYLASKTVVISYPDRIETHSLIGYGGPLTLVRRELLSQSYGVSVDDLTVSQKKYFNFKVEDIQETKDVCSASTKKEIRETYKEKRKEGLMPSEKATAVVDLIVKQTGGTAGSDKRDQLATVVDTLLEIKQPSPFKFPPDINLDTIMKTLIVAVLGGIVVKHFPEMKETVVPAKKEAPDAPKAE